MTRQVNKSLESVPPLLFHTNSLSPKQPGRKLVSTRCPCRTKMGRRAKNKQAAPFPLAGSDHDRRNKSKKKAVSTPIVRDQYKAVKGVGAKSFKDRQKRVERKGRKVDEVDEEDSELDEALQPG
jgi:hypothetical protein